jgi:CRP-like cAMP-binding protein
MTIEDDISFFERVPTFTPLGRAALRIIAIGADSRYVHSGDVLFSAGEPADAGFVIQEGSFSLSPNPANPSEGSRRVGPGTLIGELALITETRRPVTATALEPSTVLRIPRALFIKMLDGYPDAARRLRDLLARRNAQSTQDIGAVQDALGAIEMPRARQGS